MVKQVPEGLLYKSIIRLRIIFFNHQCDPMTIFFPDSVDQDHTAREVRSWIYTCAIVGDTPLPRPPPPHTHTHKVTVIIEFFIIILKASFNPFPNKPWFLRVCSTSPLKTLWEKEKLLITSNFSFSHSVFYPFRELSSIFCQIQNCRLQLFSVWKSLKICCLGKG